MLANWFAWNNIDKTARYLQIGTTVPYQVHSITDKWQPFQSESVFTSALYLASMLLRAQSYIYTCVLLSLISFVQLLMSYNYSNLEVFLQARYIWHARFYEDRVIFTIDSLITFS